MRARYPFSLSLVKSPAQSALQHAYFRNLLHSRIRILTVMRSCVRSTFVLIIIIIIIIILHRCLYCPIAYHVDCIAPKARFHELALVCHEHADMKLPELPQGASVLSMKKGAEKGCCINVNTKSWGMKGFESLEKYEGFTVPPMVLPKEGEVLSTREQDNVAFKLPLDIQREIYSKPPKFGHLNALRYPSNGARPPKNKPTEVCKCTPISEGGSGCGEGCLNRLMFIECYGGPGVIGGTNCNCGVDCSNRRLSNKETTRTR